MSYKKVLILDYNCTMEEYIKDIIYQSLVNNDNKVVETARKLKIGKSTLYRHIQANKLKRGDFYIGGQNKE